MNPKVIASIRFCCGFWSRSIQFFHQIFFIFCFFCSQTWCTATAVRQISLLWVLKILENSQIQKTPLLTILLNVSYGKSTSFSHIRIVVSADLSKYFFEFQATSSALTLFFNSESSIWKYRIQKRTSNYSLPVCMFPTFRFFSIPVLSNSDDSMDNSTICFPSFHVWHASKPFGRWYRRWWAWWDDGIRGSGKIEGWFGFW